MGRGSKLRRLRFSATWRRASPSEEKRPEATVTGNVLVQAVAAGRFASLAEARRHVAENVTLKRFEPARSPAWDEAARRYAEVEARYSDSTAV